jgi:hypothetical protein
LLDHVHAFYTSERALRCVKGLAPQHGAGNPFDCSVVLFHDVVEVFDLADRDRGPMLLIVTLDGGFIGVTAVNRDRLGDTMPADGLLEKPSGGLLVAMFGKQKVDGLAVFVDGAIELAPLALDLDVCLVHPPTDPHRALAPVKHCLQQRAILDGPPVESAVIDVNPTFFQEFLNVACAQRVRPIPAHPHENDLWGEMGTLKTDRHRCSPLCITVG